nr:hypothetical protein [uncultured Ottowia sp.]
MGKASVLRKGSEFNQQKKRRLRPFHQDITRWIQEPHQLAALPCKKFPEPRAAAENRRFSQGRWPMILIDRNSQQNFICQGDFGCAHKHPASGGAAGPPLFLFQLARRRACCWLARQLAARKAARITARMAARITA